MAPWIFTRNITLALLIMCSSQLVGNAGAKEDEETEAPSEEYEVWWNMTKLGHESWLRLQPAWTLTVNDQCLYEFVFEFVHSISLPMGQNDFEGLCTFRDPETKKPLLYRDGRPYLEPRKLWERFPSYVWATTGFNHLSIDWYACGQRPRGYAKPHYDFSFFRVAPEFRAHTMTCELQPDDQIIIPGEEVCLYQQPYVEGQNFFIVPGALINRNPVVNMPIHFERPPLGNGPIPYVGLRSFDQLDEPQFPGSWDDTKLFMSSYAGDLVMWQCRIPYDRMSGDKDIFTSRTAQYFEQTIETLPDTWAFDYDAKTQKTRLHLVGRSGLCREDFERAQEAAGGPPVFPNYEDLFSNMPGFMNFGGSSSNGGDGEGSESGEGNNNGKGKGKSGAANRPFTFTVASATTWMSVSMLFVGLMNWAI